MASGGVEPRDPPGTGRSCTFWNAGPAEGLVREGEERGGETRGGDTLGGETRLVVTGAIGEGDGAFGADCDRAATSLAAVGACGTGSKSGAGTELVVGGDTDDRDCPGCWPLSPPEIILLWKVFPWLFWSSPGCRNPRTTGAGRGCPRWSLFS